MNKSIKDSDIKTDQETLEGESGPGSFTITDPDGNNILIDQHI